MTNTFSDFMRYLAAARQQLASFPWRTTAGLMVFFMVLVLLLQYRAGVFQAEFGSEPDEAAHYVTGLFVRDYLAGGFLTHPKQFATNYYNHYPKVALGHWPPGFYLLQSAWTLPFSPQRPSMIVFMAFLAAACATAIYRMIRRESGMLGAFIGSLLFLLVPLVQQFYGAIMTEVPITLLTLLATVFFVRFLETERKSDAIWFGLIASAAIMTKFSGLLLAFVPGLAVLFSRKFYLLKRIKFWIPAFLVGILCVPWMLATLKLASDGMAEDTWGWSFTGKALPFYSGKLVLVAGFTLLFFAAVGFVTKVVRKEATPFWATLGALFVSVFLLHVLVPCGYEARHLVPIFAPTVIFAIAGAGWLASKLVGKMPQHTAIAAGLALLVSGFIVERFQIPVKGYAGFRPVALELIGTTPAQTKFLVSSDARGEGMFVAEVAMNEKRPGHIVQRTSKAFASGGWSGKGYAVKFQDDDAVLQFLEREKVEYLVVDAAIPEIYVRDHHRLLAKTLANKADRFELMKIYPQQRQGKWFPEGIRVYRFKAS